MISSPKEKGRLGIGRVMDTNFALLCKWKWRFLIEIDPLWKYVIQAKYEQAFMGDILSKGKFNSQKSPWSSIIKGVDWFMTQIKWKINDGERLSFWHSHWYEKSHFNLYRPRLFALTIKRRAP